MKRSILAVTVALALPAFAPSTARAADTPEPGTRDAIAAATTEPRFLSPWVADLPASDTVPSPSKFLGHIAGAPGELTRTEKIYAYYRALAAASDRVKVQTIGKTEEGRDILLVAVGDAASLAKMEDARTAMAALADPRTTDEPAMEAIAARTKPFYLLNGGLHSPETGSPEMLMELTYRLAVSDAEVVKQIREGLVVLVIPVAEPDGRDRMVDWFYRHLKGRTDFDNLPPHGPPYWGKYVRHDNNRDGVQRKLALTRAAQDAFLRWHPIVFHDLHESIPLLCSWTGTGPYNVNIDPLTFAEWQTIPFAEITQMSSFGMPGVWTWGFGEGWGHFYADSVAINHNAIGRGYETFGNATAETVERVLEPEQKYAGVSVTDREWYRASPPPKKFRWSLRNNTNYMETGVLTALQYTAQNGREMMRNFWRRGRNAIVKGRSEKPYAVLIPAPQDDEGRLSDMVNLLRAHGIEVRRTKAAFKSGARTFAAGSYLVRLEQPYRSYALDLLTAQEFPADKTPYEPYDDVAWALPFSYGIEAVTIDDPAVKSVADELVTAAVVPAGGVDGSGPNYLLREAGQESLFAARFDLAKFEVQAAETAFKHGGRDYPAGSWVLSGQDGLGEALGRVARTRGLRFESTAIAPSVRTHALDLPRLAVLQAWADTQSAGWMRMVLDDRAVPYTLIADEDVRAGGLRARFDVIVMPNTDDTLKEIIHGFDTRFGPLAFTKTPEFPSHGTPTSSPDVSGGFTFRGIQGLEDFVREGGVLVTLGGASTVPLDGGIAADVSHAKTKDLYTPGSELRARFRRPSHPIAYGYAEETSVFREDRTLYDVRRADRGRIVLQWGTTIPKDVGEEDKDKEKDKKDDKDKDLVVSGGIKGSSELEGKPAILDIPTGKGRVVAFDFDPIHRYLTLSDFRLVWNAILNFDDLPAVPDLRTAAR